MFPPALSGFPVSSVEASPAGSFGGFCLLIALVKMGNLLPVSRRPGSHSQPSSKMACMGSVAAPKMTSSHTAPADKSPPPRGPSGPLTTRTFVAAWPETNAESPPTAVSSRGPDSSPKGLIVWHHVLQKPEAPHKLFRRHFLYQLENPHGLEEQPTSRVLQMLPVY